ncbi:MAG: class I SAM-dependent methyltransferase [Alphaproteobacteria bacterium]|nr:class I SAM-dependent methyltransferase [Alphaproteobacteria bacterium]
MQQAKSGLPVSWGLQFAGNVARMGWYSGVNWLMRQQSQKISTPSDFEPTRPVPDRAELMGEVRALLRADAEAVREGIAPPGHEEMLSPFRHLQRLREMMADLPETTQRRAQKDASSARAVAEEHGADLPAYFTQDFHFQTGGYLTEDSARLYDVQVETLFYGAAAAMRRAGLRPISDFMKGRDQRQVSLLDVACGTGRLLREVRRVYPAMKLTGLDLSQSYLLEAGRHMGRLRPAQLLNANAEAIPLEDASQDIVSCVFLFHELPPEVRRTVSGEIARVLKPGGLFVFIDSLQMGDRPGWDGLLEAFPVRFHEPYFRSFAIDDLEQVFKDAGLEPVSQDLAFLSKVMVARKAEALGG